MKIRFCVQGHNDMGQAKAPLASNSNQLDNKKNQNYLACKELNHITNVMPTKSDSDICFVYKNIRDL